jgi:phosphate transport system substrate-binding protein
LIYASTPEVVPQCSIKPLPLGRTQGQYLASYLEPLLSHLNALVNETH